MIYYGADIGVRKDHTAIIGIEGSSVTVAERLPLGISFYDVIAALEILPNLAMDATGVGAPVAEKLPDCMPVIITCGQHPRWTKRGVYAPKRWLVGLIVEALPRLRITAPGRELLRRELATFDISLNAKSGHHDDMVTALGMALLSQAMYHINR